MAWTREINVKVAGSVSRSQMSELRSRPTVTSRSAGKVYIADPSHTVNGGGPSCRTAEKGRRSRCGLPPLSEDVIDCFLLPVLVKWGGSIAGH